MESPDKQERLPAACLLPTRPAGDHAKSQSYSRRASKRPSGVYSKPLGASFLGQVAVWVSNVFYERGQK